MELDIPRVWVRLVVRQRNDGLDTLGFEDSEGVRVRAGRGTRSPGWHERIVRLGEGSQFTLAVPDALASRLERALGRLDRWRGGATRPPVVPVFVRAPKRFAEVDWRSTVLPSDTISDRFVFLSSRRVTATPGPLTLPLHVLAVGEAGSDVLEHLGDTQNTWVDAQIGQSVSTLSWVPDARSAWQHLNERDVDLLILGHGDASRLVVPRRSRVRLAVVLGRQPESALRIAAMPLWGVRSVLLLPPPSGTALGSTYESEQLDEVGRLLRALSHDLPLHDAVREAMPGWDGTGLAGSPQSLQDLRLSSVWLEAERRVVSFEGLLGAGAHQWSTLERRVEPGSLPVLRREMPVPSMPDINFLREVDGLHPLGDVVRRLDEMEEWLAGAVSRGARSPEEARPTRVVNIQLQRQAGTLARDAHSTYVDPYRSLAASSRYSLEVQIGAPSEKSIVVGEQEPIDLLLPDNSSGHRLTVTVFTDTLDVHGPTSQDLDLPPEGASGIVRFDLGTRAPGVAWLRLNIYFRGNLVQTYRVRTVVAAEETTERELAVIADLEHTATARWDDLDALTPRDLSLVLNADDHGRHRLFVKAGHLDGMLPLDASALSGTVAAMRASLNAVVNRQAVALAADELARATLVELARLGSDAYLAVFGRSYPGVSIELLPALYPLRSAREAAVQVTRADIHQVVPWSQLYDWEIAAAGPVETCFGRRADDAPCDHGPDDGVACVNGFWGVRLLVEELLPEREGRARQGTINANDGAVLALGVTGDPATTALASDMTALLPAGRVRDLTPQDVFLDTVFAGKVTPGIILVLGGYEVGAAGTAHPHDRIKVPTTEVHLTPPAILQRMAQTGVWERPRPLVFLLSCGSSAVRTTDLTSFLSALVACGAAAIIGSQCDVYTTLARSFSIAVLARMRGVGYPSAPFCQAVHQARRDLVMKGDVRALAFDAFGPAELTLA